MEKKAVAPSPEVQYLPAIFRRIQSGDIRMPAFQRGFVWDRGQVIELLESIYQGFPIGSVLLWRVNKAELNVEVSEKSNFPDVVQKFPVSYILDGLQRLSTLYAAFHFDRKIHSEKFGVCFDLKSREFVSADESGDAILPLNVLFRPSEFVRFHSNLQKSDDGAELIQNAVDLLSIFQEYLLPIVTIEGRSAADVVQIFERINSTGVRLSAVDFMRAVTWSGHFDLNRELESVWRAASKEGFDISQETLVKVFAMALGYRPSSDAMLGMRDLSASQLREGVGKAQELLRRTTNFLKTQLQINSYSLVPYEAQFLGLVGFNKSSSRPADGAVSQVEKWFWTASLNEDLQGRSEHQVAKIVENMEAVRVGKSKLKGKLKLTTLALKERGFRWGGALSSALAAMLAKNSARSLITGNEIEKSSYLREDSGGSYLALADDEQISAAIGREGASAKVVANTIVAAPEDVRELRGLTASQVIRRLQKIREDDWIEILQSQFISENAAQAILKGRITDFLEARAQVISDFGATLGFPRS